MSQLLEASMPRQFCFKDRVTVILEYQINGKGCLRAPLMQWLRHLVAHAEPSDLELLIGRDAIAQQVCCGVANAILGERSWSWGQEEVK